MTRIVARRMVRKLAGSDVAKRLGNRVVAWAATAFAAWGMALLVAVVLAESRAGPSEYMFHSFIMAALGSLPAFLAAPVKASSGLEAVRRADRGAAVEAWLDYPGGPAERLLETRACEALSIAAIAGFGRPRPTKTARLFVTLLFALGCASFAIAQIVSVYSGYGVSLTYPDKEIPDFVAQRDLAASEGTSVILAPGAPADDLPDEQRDAPGARDYGIATPRDNESLAEPDFVATGESGVAMGEPGSATGDTEVTGNKPVRTFDRAAAGKKPRSGSIDGQDDDDGDRKPAGSEGVNSGEAREPGWTGTGRALESSPFVDYRARFERQLTEATGKETRLGDTPSAELVSEAITEFYTSFDANIAVSATVDPGLARVMEAWRKAFGAGTEAGE
jgi:hypothetical protein